MAQARALTRNPKDLNTVKVGSMSPCSVAVSKTSCRCWQGTRGNLLLRTDLQHARVFPQHRVLLLHPVRPSSRVRKCGRPLDCCGHRRTGHTQVEASGGFVTQSTTAHFEGRQEDVSPPACAVEIRTSQRQEIMIPQKCVHCRGGRDGGCVRSLYKFWTWYG